MTDRGGPAHDGWSTATRVVVRGRPADGDEPTGAPYAAHDPYAADVRHAAGGRHDDVAEARRAAASFGSPHGPRLVDHLREFVRRYGWRAYALPLLAIVSVVALTTAGTSPRSAAAAGRPSAPAPGSGPGDAGGTTSAPVATGVLPLKSDAPNASARLGLLKAGELPPGPAYTLRGDGTFRVLAGSSPVVGRGPLFRYDVEVENGITGVDTAQFAALVQQTLADPRSWSGHGVSLERVDHGPIDFHVSLTSALTVRKYCGYDIHIETSCYAAQGSVPVATVNRVVLNVARWVRGASPYVADLAQYRIYMINHEDGHAMGHRHAHQCLPGGLAPVMMQQTFGLKSATTGALCAANPWPYPPGARGTPGAEQADTSQNSEITLLGGGD